MTIVNIIDANKFNVILLLCISTKFHRISLLHNFILASVALDCIFFLVTTPNLVAHIDAFTNFLGDLKWGSWKHRVAMDF